MVSIKVLKRFEVFKGLDDKALAKIADICRERTLGEGHICFKQGNRAIELHLCCSGSVDISVWLREPWGIEVTVHRAKGGELFGWSALVEPYTYTASAKCVERTEEIYIKGSDLVDLFEPNPEMGYIVMKNVSAAVSSRLTETREKLSTEIAASINREW